MIRHWLDELDDMFRLFAGSSLTEPICFLIGAGASLSSGAPTTAAVVGALIAARPNMFPDPEAVYAKVHELSRVDRDAVTHHLFGGIVPHIGYRCLAAMARGRPVIVVNLNWDDCPRQACRRLGLPAAAVESVNLADTEQVAAALERLQARGNGLLSVHVHGMLDDRSERNPRFGTNETLEFSEREFEQLQTLLNFSTCVVGTSLSGPRDVTQLTDALCPPPGTAEIRVKRLWVVERGRLAKLPSQRTQSGHNLIRALEERRSTSNFVAAPDVDFDMLITTLRGTEVGRTWDDVAKESDALLPDRAELVPPSPAVVRPLLDAPGLLVGRAGIGKQTVAHQVAHWLSILESQPRPLTNVSGAERVSPALVAGRAASPPAVVVGHRCFGDGKYRGCAELLDGLRGADDAAGAILTSSPSHWFSAIADEAALEQAIPMIPFQAAQVWDGRALKAYARRLAPRSAANLEEAIDRGELCAPRHVELAADGQAPSYDRQELRQLTAYLKRLRKSDEESALALALIRLQDLEHAVPQSELEECCGAELDRLVENPWELVARIQIDDQHLCLARREAVIALDRWMKADRKWLAGRIGMLGERCRWARQALERWERLRECKPTGERLADLDGETVELLGPELIEPALGVSPKHAMRVLEAMYDAAPDAWAVREVAFELVRRWHSLRQCPKAQKMLDELIADADRRGMYALFEGLLRHGGIGAYDLWAPVAGALTRMLGKLDLDGNRRQVALCFDALLWRPAPTDGRQNRQLLEQILGATERDELLRAACATAAVYHWQGAGRLGALGLANPAADLGNVSEAAACEMAWVVEWHFANQSRNRALASRRYYRSTRTASTSPAQPRLLSRKPLRQALPGEAADGIQRIVAQMTRFEATAGWGVHLAGNVHATCGNFHHAHLPTAVAKAAEDDEGLAWCAIAYEPERRLGVALGNALKSEGAGDTVQRALAGELKIEGTAIRAPRFVATINPWKEVRKRFSMGSELFADLRLPGDEPWKLVDIGREVRGEVIARGADETAVEEALERLAASDIRLIERVHSDGDPAERGRKKAEPPGDLRERVVSVLFLAAKILTHERKAR